jgi:hypothetical protein
MRARVYFPKGYIYLERGHMLYYFPLNHYNCDGRQIRHLTSHYCARLRKRFADSGATTPELTDL